MNDLSLKESRLMKKKNCNSLPFSLISFSLLLFSSISTAQANSATKQNTLLYSLDDSLLSDSNKPLKSALNNNPSIQANPFDPDIDDEWKISQTDRPFVIPAPIDHLTPIPENKLHEAQPNRSKNLKFSIDQLVQASSMEPVHKVQSFTEPEIRQLFDPSSLQFSKRNEISQNSPSTPNADVNPPQPSATATSPSQGIENNSTLSPVNSVQPSDTEALRTILINFNNVSIIEYIRFVSRITNKNFIFDENDLQFNVTIISEDPSTIDDVMTALLQELRIHNLNLMEEGDSYIIYKNPSVKNVAQVVSDYIPDKTNAAIITRVFRLNTIEAEQVRAILNPMLSQEALVGILPQTNHIIITDLTANIDQYSQLIKSLDSPNSGLVVGQYVVKNAFLENLIQLAQKIMHPIAVDQPITFVPHYASNSIFVISTPFLVERAISILQHLDQSRGSTKIYGLDDLKFETEGSGDVPSSWTKDENGNWLYNAPTGKSLQPPEGDWLRNAKGTIEFQPKGQINGEKGYWKQNPDGSWNFYPYQNPTNPNDFPAGTPKGARGRWVRDANGMWTFQMENGFTPMGEVGNTGQTQILERSGDIGNWILDKNGLWVFKLRPESIPFVLGRSSGKPGELPSGSTKKVQFCIHKLLYRKADAIQSSLMRISTKLQQSGGHYGKLVNTINSVQILETTNSLIITGINENIDKVRELIEQLDLPLRQVFIEMLIMETTLTDSLNYGVNIGAEFGGGSWSGAEAFNAGGFPLQTALATTGVGLIPDATSLIQGNGYNLGIVGENLTHGGRLFNSLGALVNAVHDDEKIDVIMNPKIIAEDNTPCQIFVGQNISYKTQSVSNDLGSIITNNFEYRDIGTLLKVTPSIGSNNVITLDIQEEVSNTLTTPQTTANQIASNIVGPTTTVSRSSTRVHVPDGYFIIMSGYISDSLTRNRSQVPCLGGIPILGGAFSNKFTEDDRRNLMIFIRPKIIDTEDEIDNLTKHEQDVYRDKCKAESLWREEIDEAMDLMNLDSTAPDKDYCYPDWVY
jgi:type III secretion protein C